MDFSAVNRVLQRKKNEEAGIVDMGTPPPMPPPIQAPMPAVAPVVQAIATPMPVMPPRPQITETQTSTSGTAMTPGLSGAIAQTQAAGNAQKAAVTTGAANLAGIYDKEEKIVKEVGDAELKAAAEERVERELALQKQTERLNTYNADLTKLKDKKYESFWQRTSTGDKIAAALAIAFGAVGSALQGRAGNTALDIINQTMDEDYTRFEKGVERELDALKQSRIAESDKQALEEKALINTAAYRTAQLNQVKNKLNVLASQAKSQQARDSAAQMSAQIDAQIAQSNLQIQSMLAPKTSSVTTTKDAPVADPTKRYAVQDDMRKAVDNDKIISKAREIKGAAKQYFSIKGNDPVSDTARIQAFVKASDPTSVTSMAEMKAAIANVGLSGWFDEKMNLVKSAVMTDEQRKALGEITLGKVEAAQKEAQPVLNYYEKLAQERGFTPADVITDYKPLSLNPSDNTSVGMTMNEKRARAEELKKKRNQ